MRFGAIVSFWNWNKSDQISVKAVASANASTSGAEEPASREVASKSFVLAVHEGNENVFTETSDSGLTLAGGSEGVELLACRFLGDDFEDDLDQKSLRSSLTFEHSVSPSRRYIRDLYSAHEPPGFKPNLAQRLHFGFAESHLIFLFLQIWHA